MAIKFRNARSIATGNLSHMFYNVPVASQSFKLRVDSGDGINIAGTVNIVSRSIFDFIHSFPYTGQTPVTINLQLNGVNGTAQTNVNLTLGTVYVICMVWDGTTNQQLLYLSGVASVIGNITGNTQSRFDPVTIGQLANSGLVYTLSDMNWWDNYRLTSADAAYLTTNGDPSTIGTSATWRCQWSLAGTTGASAAIGDAGLKNTYGTGGDFATISGTGSAVYQPQLVWAPTVTATPYVTGCGKLIGATFALNTDGSLVVPSQILSTPTINVNGTDLGALTNPWFTGFHQCVTWSTPGSVMINPTDTVTLTAPVSWANTPAGPVGALSGTISNRSGGSSVGADTMTKTLRMGFNHPDPLGMEYYPYLNAKFTTGVSGQFYKMSPGHGYQIVNQPCEAGLVLIVWDATKPTQPAMMSLQSNVPTRVTVTHHPEYDVSPPNGIGYVRVYEIAYVVGSDYKTATGGSSVGFNYDDPAYTGTPNYDNLGIYLAGEWDIVGGAAVIPDRTDAWALSRIYQSRLGQDHGGQRWIDVTACGGAIDSFPDPELLLPSNVEQFWGYNPIVLPNVGLTSLGPVDPTAYPYIYSAFFRQAANLFTATLTDTISTTPAVGTHEVYHFSDAATAPLMKGLEIKIDNEHMRILDVTGTAVTLYRGSNGSTPATHSPGTVTVYGRQPISLVVRSDGTAPYCAPVFVTCNAPHGLTTYQDHNTLGSLPPILMADGSTDSAFQLGFLHATGATTFVAIFSGQYPSKPNGTKPAGVTTLNPAVNISQRAYYPRVPLEIVCNTAGRFPHANFHVNIPKDACDDLVYKMAWIVRDNFPAGRKVYVEYANEPWNFSGQFKEYSYATLMGPLMTPSQYNTYPPLSAYLYRATQVHAIFKSVFAAAGRPSEIMAIANCQMGSGNNQVTPHLNLAKTLGQPLDVIACAPYYSLGQSGSNHAATLAAFNAYDDDQACEMLLHDITYDASSGGNVPLIQSITNAVKAYNQANGANVVVIGYEGNPEFPAPTDAINGDARTHDMHYNPNYYQVEWAYYKILQDNGFVNLHKYGLGKGWAPHAWGDYHLRTQKYSRGDGVGGAANNRLFCKNPANPHFYTSVSLAQDLVTDSVRGKAFVDWNAAVSGSPPPGSYSVTGPTSGVVNMQTAPFTVTPAEVITGTITATPSGAGLTSGSAVTLSWTASQSAQTFTFTPTATGTLTITFSNAASLTDQSPATYTVTAASAIRYVLRNRRGATRPQR